MSSTGNPPTCQSHLCNLHLYILIHNSEIVFTDLLFKVIQALILASGAQKQLSEAEIAKGKVLNWATLWCIQLRHVWDRNIYSQAELQFHRAVIHEKRQYWPSNRWLYLILWNFPCSQQRLLPLVGLESPLLFTHRELGKENTTPHKWKAQSRPWCVAKGELRYLHSLII